MKKALLISLSVFAMYNCKKDTTTDPEPVTIAQVQSAKGSISGKIKQQNSSGTTYTLSLADVTVSVDGQNKSAVTDASGFYSIPDVTAGILDLTISGPDGSGTKLQQLSFVGNGNLIVNRDFSRKNLDTIIGRINDTIIGGAKGIYVKCKNNRQFSNSSTQVAIIFSKTSNIVPGDASTFDYGNTGYIKYVTNSPSEFVYAQFYAYSTIALSAKLATGTQFFVTAFPIGLNGTYFDVYSEKYVFNSAGKAAFAPLPFTIQ